METMRKLAHIPLALAALAGYLNSAELLAAFQPTGRSWAGWVGALSVSVALFVCCEAFLHRPSWVAGLAVIGFGLLEGLSQILHAAMVRSDVVILTDFLRYLMAYVAPSVVVVVGVAMAFVARYGFGESGSTVSEAAQLRESIDSLSEALQRSVGATGAAGQQGAKRRRSGPAAPAPVQLELIGSGNGKG